MRALTAERRTEVFNRLRAGLRRPDPETRRTRRILRNLGFQLTEKYRDLGASLSRSSDDPSRAAALAEVMVLASRIRSAANQLRSDPCANPSAAGKLLKDATDEILTSFESQSVTKSRIALADLLRIVTAAGGELRPEPVPVPATDASRRIVIPAELLYQAHQSLFPAERMLVAAARTSEGVRTLTAVFDVTGKAQSAHVQADPEKLARALIAMGSTDSYLLAWLHSHPGRGPSATVPSSIDQAQQQDWIRDYSPDLLGLILVEDGYVRLWGQAVDENRIEVTIRGTGIKETEERHVYRMLQ